MIGVYDYTVILTYLSLISAGTGIFISLNGGGHPYIGIFFLLFCGLCDAFDGKVARTKKNRTERERNFGIQIDSLSDVIAFGVLPACIGVAMMRTSPFISKLVSPGKWYAVPLKISLFAILVTYIVAAMIRLAYFNVTEQEIQSADNSRTHYTGLPVTSAALIFPTLAFIHYFIPFDISIFYFVVALVTAFCFLAKFHLKKPKLKGILIMIAIGLAEFIAMIILRQVL